MNLLNRSVYKVRRVVYWVGIRPRSTSILFSPSLHFRKTGNDLSRALEKVLGVRRGD